MAGDVQVLISSKQPFAWRRAQYDPPPPDMPIPDRLNAALVVGVFAVAIAILWFASQVESWYALLGIGIAFSYVLLTNYALLHEATHHNLHSNPHLNYLFGMVAGMLFPVPFSLVYTTHQGHHLRNRTDYEMFDLYYPNDNRLLKYAQWYSILCGLFWPVIPIGAFLYAAFPRLLRTKVFRQARSSSYLLGDVQTKEIRAIRIEVLLIVAFYTVLFQILSLHVANTVILYACFAFNWSTRQYVGHAFTKRDVIDGAWNLRHNRLMSWVLLHGEYDLNHHRRPDVSWLYLPHFTRPEDPRPRYIRQYLRLWLGPRPASEPAPESLQTLRLSVHD
jgi:fatty acid desaturase